jgi:hypothetical protein
MQRFTTLSAVAANSQIVIAVAAAVHLLVTPTMAADRRAVCDRVAALGPEGLKGVLLPMDDGATIVDIDGDKVDERLKWRWEMTTMHPRLWFIENAKGEPYLGDGTRSIDFEGERGSVLYPEFGYEIVWIKLDSNVFALGMHDERHVNATDLTQFRRGRAEPLCTFDHTVTVEWTPSPDIDEKICRAANAGAATNLAFKSALVDWYKGLRAPMLEIDGAGTAEADLDRDGSSDPLVRWQFHSGGGRGCALHWLDVHKSRPNVTLRKALLDAQGFQMDPAGQYSYYSQMLPRDEFGWSRCGDVNEIVHIEGRPFVNANDRLTALDGGVARLACQGKRITRWRVKKYAE